MKSFWKREKYPLFVMVCGGILLCQILLIGICNFTLGPKNIDCDSAMLFVHAIEMAKNHSYIIPEWSILTTLELDCSLLFAMPLFLLTKNVYVSFGIANMLMIAILIGTLFAMFWEKSKVYPLVCANFILIPYSIGQLEYFNMLFFNGGQYIVKVLLPLMLIALLVRLEAGKMKSLGYIFLVVLYGVFLLISCVSSSVYVPAVGIFPVFAGYLCYCLYCRKRAPFGYWIFGGISALLIVVGLWGNARFATDARGNVMTLCSVLGDELRDNISACFFSMFELFKGMAYENVKVMSFSGIRVLLHMGFVLLLLLCGFIGVRKVLQKKANFTSVMLLAVFLWNTFILCVCNTRYGAYTFEHRYHLVGMIPLICVGVSVVLEWYEKEEKAWKVGIASTIVLLLLALNISSYKGVFTHEYDSENYQQICDYVTEEKIGTVYFYNDSTPSEVCRLLDYKNEDVTYLAVDGAGDMMVYNYYSKYLDMPITFDNAVFVTNNTYWDFGDAFEMFGHKYERIETIGIFSIYR